MADKEPQGSVLVGRKLAIGASILTALLSPCAKAAQAKSKHELKERDLMLIFFLAS